MDAEWGIGMRLDDAFSFPYNMTLGALNDDNLIYQVGKRIGVHAKRLGVHMNYAPVTDINTNPNNPIIGSRSFGEDKVNVISNLFLIYWECNPRVLWAQLSISLATEILLKIHTRPYQRLIFLKKELIK